MKLRTGDGLEHAPRGRGGARAEGQVDVARPAIVVGELIQDSGCDVADLERVIVVWREQCFRDGVMRDRRRAEVSAGERVRVSPGVVDVLEKGTAGSGDGGIRGEKRTR